MSHIYIINNALHILYAKQKPLTSATKVLEMNGQTNKRLNLK